MGVHAQVSQPGLYPVLRQEAAACQTQRASTLEEEDDPGNKTAPGLKCYQIEGKKTKNKNSTAFKVSSISLYFFF